MTRRTRGFETNVTFDQRDTWFGRFEVAEKTAHDLDVAEPPDRFTVVKLQGLHAVSHRTEWLPTGTGGAMSVGMVPDTLRCTYGSRANFGFAVYLTFRRAAMMYRVQGTAPTPVDHSQHAPAQPAGPGAQR